MSECVAKPVWRKNPIPDNAVGRYGGSEYLACPECGEFVTTNGPTIPSMFNCTKCGQLMDMDDVLDDVFTEMLQSQGEREESETC